MATLYRQYRPQRFADVAGQHHVISTLEQAITKDRLAHAYLFYGPRGTGKTSTARILAKRLNCTTPAGVEPCGTCPLCTATQQGSNLDLIEIDAASNRGIDDIRALKEGISSAPAAGRYKVYIIDEVHMLTNEAFTALLKTLEEPVKHAVFILATTELHKVPETILSRCQVYRFRRATGDELTARLTHILAAEQREISAEALAFIVGRSDGCYRDAESLLGQMLTLHETDVSLSDITTFLGLPPPDLISNFLQALVQGDASTAIAAVDTAFAEGFDPEQLLRESVQQARDVAVALATGKTHPSPVREAANAAARLPVVIRTLLQALQDLAYVPQPLIAVHLAILTLATATTTQPVTPPAPRSVAPRPAATAVPRVPKKAAVAAVATPTAGGSLTLSAVEAAWPQVLTAVKAQNPVASTFLRAMRSSTVTGSTLTLQTQYLLHYNFFSKPANRTILTDAFSAALGTPVTITLARPSTAPPATAPAAGAEGDLLATVKEVFSSTPKKAPEQAQA